MEFSYFRLLKIGKRAAISYGRIELCCLLIISLFLSLGYNETANANNGCGNTEATKAYHDGAKLWLSQTRDIAKHEESQSDDKLRVPIGTTSYPEGAPLKLVLMARFQNFNTKPQNESDYYDPDILSPKSVRFAPDGKKAYVNSLEGYRTVIYDPNDLKKIGTIHHRFGPSHASLFQGATSVFGYRFNMEPPSGNVNHFQGKPVESEISHHGKYLWVPYYRRHYDIGATSPSAVAIIDVETDSIVRVMPTGPIPKYVEASPDNHWLAIVHWGDNTVGLIDVSSGDPAQFKYTEKRLVVERILSQEGLADKDRDKACGYCLRGAVFTPDAKTLLVARMGGGGIAGFDVETHSYLGTVLGMRSTPRHLLLSKDGKTLFLSSNVSGYVSRIELNKVLQKLRSANGRRVDLTGWQETYVGIGARTIALSPDEKVIFAAVNIKSELIAILVETMDIICRVRTDKYTVGLAVSPDGTQVWTTSQGRQGKGGNSVCVYRLEQDILSGLSQPNTLDISTIDTGSNSAAPE